MLDSESGHRIKCIDEQDVNSVSGQLSGQIIKQDIITGHLAGHSVLIKRIILMQIASKDILKDKVSHIMKVKKKNKMIKDMYLDIHDRITDILSDMSDKIKDNNSTKLMLWQ
jgi:hypothetical protein